MIVADEPTARLDGANALALGALLADVARTIRHDRDLRHARPAPDRAGRRRALARIGVDGTVSDTIQVSGVRCERCVGRLAGTLRQVEGIEAANANLMGQVTLSWDDELTTREAIVETLSRGGFPELQQV